MMRIVRMFRWSNAPVPSFAASFAAAWMVALFGQSAQAQTFDPSDPFRMRFLDQMSAMVGSATTFSLDIQADLKAGGDARNVDASEVRRLRQDLADEIQECGTRERLNLSDGVVNLMVMNQTLLEPRRMRQLGLLVDTFDAASRSDLDAIDRLMNLLDRDFLTLTDTNGNGRLEIGEPSLPDILDVAGDLFSRERFYRSVVAIGDKLLALDAMTEAWRRSFYPSALFHIGEIEKLDAFAADNEVNLIQDWLVTTQLRLGNETEAQALQAQIDAQNPSNLPRILFYETPTARAAHCEAILEDRNTRVDQEQSEASFGNVNHSSWPLLVCGQFADSRRGALKVAWGNRAGACSSNKTNLELVDLYNGILAGVYQAAELREKGALEESTELLDIVAEEVRRALFLDGFTGLSSLEVVLEDDIPIYMLRLHGDAPELRIVEGMLERARGNSDQARTAFRKALELSGLDPDQPLSDPDSDDPAGRGDNQLSNDSLEIGWLLRLAKWIDEIEAQAEEG